jgi:hypothetical protein
LLDAADAIAKSPWLLVLVSMRPKLVAQRFWKTKNCRKMKEKKQKNTT